MKRLGASLLGLVFLFYTLSLHYSDQTQVGIVRNWITGEIRLDTPGWNITPPWSTVAKVDTRPMRVCVMSSGRGFNCRLVQFQPQQFSSFVETEGFYYYWWANRFSVNFGYAEEYRGMRDLLRGYSYSVRPYSFVKVLREYQEGE